MPPFRKMLLLGLAAALALGLGACGRGPFSPEARRQSRELDQYLKALQADLLTDDTFEWNTLSSALTVKALAYSGPVRQAAEQRFRGDPAFQEESSRWAQAPGRRHPPLVILMGLFAPDLQEQDVAPAGRFRPRLRTADGRSLKPLEIKSYGRGSVFVRDHFPVFNPWEAVYLLRFPSPGAGPEGRLDFLLEWPGGVQTMAINDR
ncbi:MAG: hypothetical protein LBP33_11205 [Candidatus Adiutrix sp.]|jgi:hypothetical protein|nr:hypothetical protein [Candidatus Adiutrix sp.]